MKIQLEKAKDKKKVFQKKLLKISKKQNQQQGMEQKKEKTIPISWKQSEAIQHMYGESSLETKEETTGLYDRQSEHSPQTQMKEVFHADNSYGNVAVGANKKQEAMVVVSQKREHNGKTTEEYQKNLHMERKKKKISPNGDFLMNNSHLKESAWAYKGNTKLSEKRVFDEIKKYSEKEESRMLEKRMPFLLLEKDKKQMVSLREQVREQYEKGDKKVGQFLERQKETLQHEMEQKEQNEKLMQKKIKFAWEKAKKIASDDFEIRKNSSKKEEEIEEELTEIPNSEQNNTKKSKK